MLLGLIKPPTAERVRIDGATVWAMDRRRSRAASSRCSRTRTPRSIRARRSPPSSALPLAVLGSATAAERRAKAIAHARRASGCVRDIADVVSERALRRPAPARRHRARPGGRAARSCCCDEPTSRARRLGAVADPEPAARPAARFRPHLCVHQPQSRGGRAHRDPRRGDVSRPHRRDARRATRCSITPPSLHAGRCSTPC